MSTTNTTDTTNATSMTDTTNANSATTSMTTSATDANILTLGNKMNATTTTKPKSKSKSPHRLKSRKRNQFGRLAMQYYPGRGYKAAVRAFRKEIEQTRGLMSALSDTGYTSTQRLLSPRQVSIIEDYLGEP
jgi:hypothetical protein